MQSSAPQGNSGGNSNNDEDVPLTEEETREMEIAWLTTTEEQDEEVIAFIHELWPQINHRQDIAFEDVAIMPVQLQRVLLHHYRRTRLSSQQVQYLVAGIREEGEHQFMGQAGLSEDVDMFAPVMVSAKRRALWLGVNLITAFLASWVIGQFQGTIEKIVALSVLMPIVANMGGIAGTQTMTLAIRGIALRQLSSSNMRWPMRAHWRRRKAFSAVFPAARPLPRR